MKNTFRIWLPLAIGLSCLCTLAYLSIQQILRMNANDPQIEYAEDISSRLSAGQSPASVVPPAPVDFSRSLATFIIIAMPTIPSGVIAYAKAHGEDRITWQPKSGVRIAAVVARYTGAAPGYVLLGRSLREIENREGSLLLEVFTAWILSLVVTFAGAWCGQKYLKD
jgi:hypothetical protein